MDLQNLEQKFIQLQFGTQARLRVYRKLARLLHNGVPMTKALDIMYQHASADGKKPKHPVAICINEWRKSVREGKQLHRAIKGWVPDQDRLVIAAGEDGGDPANALDNAVFVQENAGKIKSAIFGGLAYPFALILIAVGFLVFFSLRIVPAFARVLPPEQWTGQGAQMAVVSGFVQDYMLYVGIGAVALCVAVTMSMPRWTGELRIRFDKIPPWSIYRLYVGSGYLLGLSAMLSAGVPIPKILETMKRDANPWFRERISATLNYVNEGSNLGDAMHKAGYEFPDRETVIDMRTFASLAGFEDMLQRMGREWMENSVDSIRAQTAVLRNIGFLVMGGTFIWIASGIFSLQQQIADSSGGM